MAEPLAEAMTTSPWEAFQAVVSLPFPLFLDSALQHPALGRYSYVAADPFAMLRCRCGRVEWFPSSYGQPLNNGDPFRVLASSLMEFKTRAITGFPPFQGGIAGLFGYDLCHYLERLPRPRYDEFHLPDLAVGFYDWVYAFDHIAEQGWLISTGLPKLDREQRRTRAEMRLHQAKHLIGSDYQKTSCIAAQNMTVDPIRFPLALLPELYSSFCRNDFLDAIRRAIEYIHAGDCFQVNLAQRLLYPSCEASLGLYRKLREGNPATFAGYFDLGDCVIASASPERFLSVDSNGWVEARPIKGTRPRGAIPEADRQNREELERSAKDRAENVMIVDLLRNDLGRVAEYGSVQVSQLCKVESYETVHHLVSVINGQLRNGMGPVELLRAAFPGGSVTGAPKIRAMEIIAELEPTARGAYCGSLGYIGFNGTMDTSILIRTFTVSKGWIQFPVGGGIVADSKPEDEYQETLDKAAGMLRALI